MPKLFWKLFSAFWLATVTILAVSIFASFRLADLAFDERLDPREADELVRQQLAAGGVEALKRWIAGGRDFPGGQTVYLVGPELEDLLGRSLPRFVARRARHLWLMADLETGRGRGLRARAAPIVHEAEDLRLIALPGPTPPPRFGVFASPGLRWTVLGLAAVISFIVFWLLSRSLTRPVAQISAAAARLAGGDMSARVGATGRGHDEIEQLARQFDRMADELQAQSEQRRELFRNISHELRAPLARLEIAAELLGRKPEQAETQLARVRQEIETLDQLTGQVVALARVQQPGAAREPVALLPLLERIATDAGYEGAERDVRVRLVPVQDAPCVPADAALLHSAIENVVRNAVQASPDHGIVHIECKSEDGRCRIVVRDDGPGVPETELARIFEPFYRLDQNRPGAGVGLAITARVIRELGGAAVAANRPGGGFEVTLTL